MKIPPGAHGVKNLRLLAFSFPQKAGPLTRTGSKAFQQHGSLLGCRRTRLRGCGRRIVATQNILDPIPNRSARTFNFTTSNLRRLLQAFFLPPSFFHVALTHCLDESAHILHQRRDTSDRRANPRDQRENRSDRLKDLADCTTHDCILHMKRFRRTAP
jgi:hypothetical protein